MRFVIFGCQFFSLLFLVVMVLCLKASWRENLWVKNL